jgi:pimeloyl-ACP methyl ester carboxylesterase
MPAPPPGVLGSAPTSEQVGTAAMFDFQADPDENACYMMLHEIATPTGTVYDITLPVADGVAGAMAETGILGSSGGTMPAGMMHFPMHRMMNGRSNGTAPADSDTPPGVLGGLGEAIADLVVGEALRHVVRVFKAPIDSSLRAVVASRETRQAMVTITPDATIDGKIEGAEAWRSRFAPHQSHRILIVMHGFGSNIERTMPGPWVKELYEQYDAVLGFDHPTITQDPLENARNLIEMVPPDIQFDVDLVVHSRGGLVARSLVELQPLDPRLNVQHLITCGSPHAGTVLADPERWDRLISIGFTTASWLTALTGVTGFISFIPRALEFLLRAASQFIFDLPGINAMTPNSPFLQRLNQPSDLMGRVQYAALTGSFNPLTVPDTNIRDALAAFATQVFFQVSNDLVVPTESMRSIDMPAASQLNAVRDINVNHFEYFNNREGLDFAADFLNDRLPA